MYRRHLFGLIRKNFEVIVISFAQFLVTLYMIIDELIMFVSQVPGLNLDYVNTVTFSSVFIFAVFICIVLALCLHEKFTSVFSGFQFVYVQVPIFARLRLSHNSSKMRLFILFHSSLPVLLFKMFVHQMFVRPGR